MSDHFVAQSLVETKTTGGERRFEMTFVDAMGERQTVSIPSHVAADLVPVLTALAEGAASRAGVEFTKIPKACSVGRARHEPLVLIRFDDEPAYALDAEEAGALWREVREQAELVSALGAPVRH